MPETTNNDAPGADRPTARAGQEAPAKAGGAARPPHEVAAEQNSTLVIPIPVEMLKAFTAAFGGGGGSEIGNGLGVAAPVM